MRKSKYSEHQIVGALKRAEAGVPVKDLCRELGISSATFYQWRPKVAGACYGSEPGSSIPVRLSNRGFQPFPARDRAPGWFGKSRTYNDCNLCCYRLRRRERRPQRNELPNEPDKFFCKEPCGPVLQTAEWDGPYAKLA
jgi:putative transposase